MIKKQDILNFLYYTERDFYEEHGIIFVREGKGEEFGTALKFDGRGHLTDIYSFDLR